VIALVLSALLGAACAPTLRTLPSAEEMESQAVEARQSYEIGPGDVLQVSVWRQPELSVESVVVRLDGKISVPLIDDVQASGLTPLELKEVVTERLAEYVGDPTVTVVVLQVHSKMVYVLGEVARQGPISLRSEMRVVDALSVAGGFSTFANKGDVKIIRSRNGGAPVEFRFDYESFVDGSDLEQNILLLPGDKIVVP
jgi:polysaccharide export outer membrane protein